MCIAHDFNAKDEQMNDVRFHLLNTAKLLYLICWSSSIPSFHRVHKNDNWLTCPNPAPQHTTIKSLERF